MVLLGCRRLRLKLSNALVDGVEFILDGLRLVSKHGHLVIRVHRIGVPIGGSIGRPIPPCCRGIVAPPAKASSITPCASTTTAAAESSSEAAAQAVSRRSNIPSGRIAIPPTSSGHGPCTHRSCSIESWHNEYLLSVKWARLSIGDAFLFPWAACQHGRP